MTRFLFVFIFFLFVHVVAAQEFYQLQPAKIKLGKVEDWKNDTLWFTLANTGDQPWFILPQHYGREFQLIYSRQTINPGFQTRIGVIYYTEEEGSFKLDIPLYINVINEAIELKVSGLIKSIDPNALVQCPTVNRPPTMQPVSVASRVKPDPKPEVDPEENENIDQDYAFEQSFIEEDPPSEPEMQQAQAKFDNPDAFAPDAPANNIVLLLDKSRSMGAKGKMESLKTSVSKLIDALRPQDQITIITYSRVVKIPLLADDQTTKDQMHGIVNQLQAKGGSYGGKGMLKAFDLAKKYRLRDGNNAIILATDGKFNDREITEDDLFKEAQKHSRRGITVSGLAFGDDPRALDFLKALSESGRGQCIEVEQESDSDRMILQLVKDLSSFQ